MIWAHEHSYERLFPLYKMQVRYRIFRIHKFKEPLFYLVTTSHRAFFVAGLQWITGGAIHQPLRPSSCNYWVSGMLSIFIKRFQVLQPKFCLKAGVHMKAVFWLGSMFFMQISR